MESYQLDCKMPAQQVLGRIRHILEESHKNDNYWQFKRFAQEEGHIIAVLAWREYFGDILKDQERSVRLEIKVEPVGGFEEMYSRVILDIDVRSPMHAGQVNQVVETVLKDIRAHTNAVN